MYAQGRFPANAKALCAGDERFRQRTSMLTATAVDWQSAAGAAWQCTQRTADRIGSDPALTLDARSRARKALEAKTGCPLLQEGGPLLVWFEAKRDDATVRCCHLICCCCVTPVLFEARRGDATVCRGLGTFLHKLCRPLVDVPLPAQGDRLHLLAACACNPSCFFCT